MDPTGIGTLLAGIAAMLGALNYRRGKKIDHSLNGHPSDETLGLMLYQLRESVIEHHSRPADEAHPGSN